MEKSADAFRTISEVADDLDLPQHVLRFWETRFPQIRPLKRAGGRRYYRPADVGLLRMIRVLLYDEGYTIKGVQRLLKEQGVRSFGAAPRSLGDLSSSEAHGSASGEDPAEMASDLGYRLAREAENEPRITADLPPEDVNGPLVTGGAGPNRAALSGALAALEECERILRALRSPDR